MAYPQKMQPLPRPTAVVADDSAASRKMVRMVLEQAGFDVVAECERGDEAVILFEQFRPTVIMLDIVMPILDGMAAATIILRRHPDAVIIVCSSLNHREKILACRELGVRYFVLKPIFPQTVIKIANGVLARICAETTQPEVASP